VGSAAVGQLLLQHQRQERAEDMAPDRRVAGALDRPRAQLHSRLSEQILAQPRYLRTALSGFMPALVCSTSNLKLPFLLATALYVRLLHRQLP
jgi:hypothetical protein